MPRGLKEGTTLHQRYIIRQLLVESEHHNLYIAEDQKLKADRVIHEFSPTGIPRDKLTVRRKAYQEATAQLSKLKHPNIAEVIEVFTDAGREYVAFEYMEGTLLSERLESLKARSESATDQQVLSWAMQVSDIFEYLHSVHMVGETVKAENLQENTAGQLELIKLGLSRYFTPEDQPALFTNVPTELLADYPRFGHLLAELMQVLSDDSKARPELEKLSKRLVSHEKSPTFGSFKEVRSELLAILQRVQPAPEKAPEEEPVVLPGGRSPLYWGAVIFVVLSLIVGSVWYYLRSAELARAPRLVAASADGHVVAVNSITHETVFSGALGENSQIVDVAVTPNGKYLILCDARNNELIAYEIPGLARAAKIGINPDPLSFVLAPDGNHCYVMHGKTRVVSQVSLKDLRATNIYQMPSNPTGITVSADGQVMYVAMKDQTILGFDLGAQKATTKFVAGEVPGALAVSPDGSELWVACPEKNSVRIFTLGANPTLKTDITELNGSVPVAVYIRPDGVMGYVLCRGSSTISIIPTFQGKVTERIPTGGSDPVGWVPFTSGDIRHLAILQQGSSTISILNLTSGVVTSSIPVVQTPVAISVGRAP